MTALQTVFQDKRRFQRALFVNLYGLGNCLFSTPAIKALTELGYKVDVLLRRERQSDLAFKNWDQVEHIFYSDTPMENLAGTYDFAVCGHPVPQDMFGGQLSFLQVNPNPNMDVPYQWRFKRHEILEIFELVRRLGYKGEVPALREPHSEAHSVEIPERSVAIGIGYAKEGDWVQSHWGNEKFIALCRALKAQGFRPLLFGDQADQDADGNVIEKEASVLSLCGKMSLAKSFSALKECVAYIGNDTIHMHVASACRIPTIGIFCATNAEKSRPWGAHGVDLKKDATAEQILLWLNELLQAFSKTKNEAKDEARSISP